MRLLLNNKFVQENRREGPLCRSERDKNLPFRNCIVAIPYIFLVHFDPREFYFVTSSFSSNAFRCDINQELNIRL